MVTWTIDPGRSRLVVRTKSTLHSSQTEGPLQGRLHGDPDALEITAGGTVQVPMAEQVSGDRLRDTAMRRHIDVRRWPEARFTVDAVRVVSREPWEVRVSGQVEYHDTQHPLTVTATGGLGDGALEARTEFRLALKDVGVKPPRLLFLKVADEVDVSVHIVAKEDS